MHTQFGHFFLIKHRGGDVLVVASEAARFAGQKFGRANIAGEVDQFPGQIGALAEDHATHFSSRFGFPRLQVPPAASVTRLSALAGFFTLIQCLAVLVVRQTQLQAELFDQWLGALSLAARRCSVMIASTAGLATSALAATSLIF